jgi:type 1 glutamine amidotransferase
MHEEKNKIRVLLVSGRVIAEHYYPACNERARRLLESTGRFEVKINEEFNGCTEATLEDYDVIFLNYDGRGKPDPVGSYQATPYKRWNPETEQVFFNFVKNGGGLYIHHSSVILSSDLPDEYSRVWGACSLQDGKGSRWNPLMPDGTFAVKLAEGTQFTKDLPEQFTVVREDFYSNCIIHPEANIEVLASVYDDIEPWIKNWGKLSEERKAILCAQKPEDLPNINKWQPYVWTNTYGAGRIFANLLGNDYETWNRIPYMTLLCRGVEWAATGKITIEPPDISGNRKFRPWPYYDNLDQDCKTFKDVISTFL